MEVVATSQPAAANGGGARRQMVIGGGWLWGVIGVFWSFHNGKHSLPIGMLDSHGGGGNVLGVKFIPGNVASNLLSNMGMFLYSRENKKMYAYQASPRVREKFYSRPLII